MTADHSSATSNNVEVVKSIYAAFSRRDIQAILDVLDPDVEWGEPPNPFNPAAGTRHGHQGFLEWLEVGHKSEEILVIEPRKFLVDEDSVAVVGYNKCRALTTNRKYESDFVHLVTLREGKVVKFQEFFDTYAAAEAFRP